MINKNYLKLPGSYLFATIGRKVKEFSEANPDKSIVRLGIGDVSMPLAPAIVKAMHEAADIMGKEVKGYPDYEGYDFLREAIVAGDYKIHGLDVDVSEIFVNDGAKCDSADLGDIFATDAKIAICNPVYPVYEVSNAMVGRAGEYCADLGQWSNLIYLPCTEANGFVPDFPEETPDVIYLCFPNNPTGSTITKDQLQEWVDYANRVGAVIIFDAAYESYITEPNVPRSIFECEGARTCAIEMRSFSKNAGFTGTRLGFTVIPKDLVRDGVSLHKLWTMHQENTFNGVSYIVQAAGAAVYTPEGRAQTQAQVDYYMKNANTIRESLASMGYTVYGGVNAPYVWLKTPDQMTSWEFFDHLLGKANVVGTPGSGFGSCGEGFFRLTGFGSAENTAEALRRIKEM